MRRLIPLLISLILLPGVATAADWYVSFSRGNDTTGDGTIDLPYKTLGKIVGGSGVASDNDRMLLACDDSWHQKSVGGWKDDLDAVTVTSYEPTGVSCEGHKPHITFFVDTTTGNWTWDATEEAWYFSNPSGVPEGGMIALFGEERGYGGKLDHFDATVATPWGEDGDPEQEYDWDRTTGRLYVWSPSSDDNPVTYYNGIRVLSGPVFPMVPTPAKTEGNGVIFDGIHFSDIGTFVSIKVNSGTGAPHTGIRITNSSGYRFGALLHIQNDYNAANAVSSVEIDNSLWEELLAGGVLVARGQVTDIKVHDNIFRRCNQAWTKGGCTYITGWETDVIMDQDAHIYDNFAEGCTGGPQTDHNGDGGCFYQEAGHNNVNVYRNRIENSEAAFWANGGVSTYHDNVVVNTGILLNVGDSTGLNRVSVIIANNTAECLLADGILTPYVERTWDVFRGCISVRASAVNNASEDVTFKNNILIVHPDGEELNTKGISVSAGETGTVTEEANLIFGAPVPYGNPGNNTPRTLAANSLTDDPLLLYGTEPDETEDAVLLSNSPAINAGVCWRTIGCAYSDIDNHNRGSAPDIGGYEKSSGGLARARASAATRETAASRATSTTRSDR